MLETMANISKQDDFCEENHAKMDENDENQEPPKKLKKTNLSDNRLKICVHCGEKSGNRKRVCPCGNIFDIRKKTLQERIPSGQTSLSAQRDIVHSRMIGMKEKHGWNSFVIYAKKGERNMMLDTFSTPGFSAEFFGEKGNRTQAGEMILCVVRDGFEGYCEAVNNQSENQHSAMKKIVKTIRSIRSVMFIARLS
ncbi:uncharacterized protein LOC130648159 isoform X2 [Hydractinia symbiolongicarpus]|uniref:uncharacterized protein LOC130648159 isoform X2 n=1 Tax=Hydractinia symbiolongicarpus TaxID=13093 RepID=UPI00254D6A4C|nr:uncharacterized protein LOC130648159 isoform X2 [Hydractinia symbiolongicarpus]